MFGTASAIQQVEKTSAGICIISSGKDVIFLENDGTLAKNEWQLCGADWYYLDEKNGDIQTGWKKVNNRCI